MPHKNIRIPKFVIYAYLAYLKTSPKTEDWIYTTVEARIIFPKVDFNYAGQDFVRAEIDAISQGD